MTVLLKEGRKDLKVALHTILDAFLTEDDYLRGIFIKPNIVFPVSSKSGEITPVNLTRALISTLRESHPEIDIVFGEGVAAGCDPQKNFRVSGYAGLAVEFNIPLLDLNHAERITVQWKFGKLDLPRIAFERTYINLPILKPSSACGFSAALKNQKGLLLPETKKQFHRLGLHEQIAELNRVIKPTFTIMDCSHFFGRGSLISGDNCGEIDSTTCRLLNIKQPDHLRLAEIAGVFSSIFSVSGDDLRLKHSTSGFLKNEYKRFGGLRLWSNPQACTMCRYLFYDVLQDSLKPRGMRKKIKLLFHSIRGAEIIIGSNPNWRKGSPTVICVGNCTHKEAIEGKYVFVPGCPPSVEDFFRHIP